MKFSWMAFLIPALLSVTTAHAAPGDPLRRCVAQIAIDAFQIMRAFYRPVTPRALGGMVDYTTGVCVRDRGLAASDNLDEETTQTIIAEAITWARSLVFGTQGE